jgi:hypothetical protein
LEVGEVGQLDQNERAGSGELKVDAAALSRRGAGVSTADQVADGGRDE